MGPFHDLEAFVARHRRLFVLTGAGCSVISGIPDYRDAAGRWKRPQPVTYQAFLASEATRRRYWARSLLGWPRFREARPNAAHRALARLEGRGDVAGLVTQNVDRLHQAAGSRTAIDLHGRLDRVRCLGCGERTEREGLQERLARLNPGVLALDAATAPDGDADLEGADLSDFVVPPCPRCGGTLKPDVVFFGESVPRARVERAFAQLDAADAVLVVGSSLMVYSGYRFALRAAERGLPIAAVNLGTTRADPLIALKVEAPCEAALAFLLAGEGGDRLRAGAGAVLRA